MLLCSPPVFQPPVSRRPVEGMVNALFIAIHARFVRDMARLPGDVEVILCTGPEGTTRDFDDFSTTEHLIALGRAEASEVVRRYGLGTIAYPAPPHPVPDLGPDTATAVIPGERRSGDRRTGDRRTGVVEGEVSGGQSPVSGGRSPASGDPVTQPEPGT